MMYEYLILDFGKVMASPTTGEWFITPKFKELVNMELIDISKLKEAFIKYGYLKNGCIKTEAEEYNAFYNFYSSVLKEVYPFYNDKIAEEIAYNFTYKDDKYTFYDGVEEELIELSKKYKLIMLTDNWPCVIRILKEKNIYDLFLKVYVSSIYGVQKKDQVFFDYPINEYNIKKALFIDDSEELLDIAYLKGLDVKIMDRNNEVKNSKYEIIHDLKGV